MSAIAFSIFGAICLISPIAGGAPSDLGTFKYVQQSNRVVLQTQPGSKQSPVVLAWNSNGVASQGQLPSQRQMIKPLLPSYQNAALRLPSSRRPTSTICCVGQANSSRGMIVPNQCVTFDASRDLCCKSATGFVKNGKQKGMSCCGGTTPYSIKNDLCCDNGNVTPDGITSGLTCCGTTAHKVGVDLCCNRGQTLIVNGVTNGMDCCGPLAYDTLRDLCCSNANNTAGTVTRNATPYGMSCCGQMSYSPINDLCCDEVVYTAARVGYPHLTCPNGEAGPMAMPVAGHIYPASNTAVQSQQQQRYVVPSGNNRVLIRT